jgi:hypothetical protein
MPAFFNQHQATAFALPLIPSASPRHRELKSLRPHLYLVRQAVDHHDADSETPFQALTTSLRSRDPDTDYMTKQSHYSRELVYLVLA